MQNVQVANIIVGFLWYSSKEMIVFIIVLLILKVINLISITFLSARSTLKPERRVSELKQRLYALEITRNLSVRLYSKLSMEKDRQLNFYHFKKHVLSY